ncbi:hypothetical protein IDH44_22555 [Paenibacillus sp. IB182496]|uniref:Uncharacterized protein n=1 Tax=Paenibacillus sabuli TaxID=2772509 RepID=A0A927BX63_9BACL|nr:hypothetical protein [Paenibacillus sabuli]MBD2847987.1 hypothetical protein [Paenibacillus sabuli]
MIKKKILFSSFVVLLCLLVVSMNEQVIKANNSGLEKDLELNLINKNIRNELMENGMKIKESKLNSIFRSAKNSNGNNGKINLKITNSKVIKGDTLIDGTVKVKFNELEFKTNFDNQKLLELQLENGDYISLIEIDSKVDVKNEKRNSSVFFALFPNEEKYYASVSVGEINSGDFLAVDFGERFLKKDLMNQVEQSLKIMEEKEFHLDDQVTSKQTSAASVNWGSYTYKATVDTAFSDSNQYWGRAAVLAVGRKYSTNCQCGEVILKAFVPYEDVENESGNNYIIPNKIKMGVEHNNGQVNEVYPLETSSTSTTVIYDFLSVAGVPTNTIASVANGFSSSITHLSGNSGNPQDKAIEYARGLGLSSTTFIPANVSTNNVVSTYDGVQRGATAYFNVSNYQPNATVKSYAQVRYNARTVSGLYLNLWSDEAYAIHYVNQ